MGIPEKKTTADAGAEFYAGGLLHGWNGGVAKVLHPGGEGFGS